MFEEASLEAVRAALAGLSGRGADTPLHAENLPVIFVPCPGGGDLQTSPLVSVSVIRNLAALADKRLAPRKTDRETDRADRQTGQTGMEAHPTGLRTRRLPASPEHEWPALWCTA